jgi:hypothetical protein
MRPRIGASARPTRLVSELRDVVSAMRGSVCIPSRRYKLKVIVPGDARAREQLGTDELLCV